jgi:hypothetical protein
MEGAALNRPLARQFDGNEERKGLPQTTLFTRKLVECGKKRGYLEYPFAIIKIVEIGEWKGLPQPALCFNHLL